MKVQKITQNNLLHTRMKRQNVDLKGFGETAQPQTSPIDEKKADEAIKSNFLANVSFGGHTKRINVSRYDEHYYTKKQVPILAPGTSGRIVGYETKSEIAGIKNTEYVAGGYQSSDVDVAIRRAIIMSDDYQGGAIEKSGSFYISETCGRGANNANAKVYFADKDEGVYKDIIRDHHYVVYAPGSYKSDYDNYGEEINSDDSSEYCPFEAWGWSYT